MLQELEQLLIIQDRDRKIRAMNRELTTIPIERHQIEEKLAANRGALEAVRQRGKELEVEKKKLEIDAQSKRDSIAKYRLQQFQTRKNEEFQALSNEIARFEKDIESIEDRELEIMEQAEKVRADGSISEREVNALKLRIDQQLSDLEAKTKSIDEHLTALATDRAQLATAIDDDLLDRYNRLFASKGDSAVVPLEHEVCMGCHMKITTQTAVRVKANREIMSCEQCGRILYAEG